MTGSAPGPAPLLEVRGLTIRFTSGPHAVTAVQDVGFTVESGQVVALIGESGAGKTTTALALLGLLPASSTQVTGQALFGGKDLLALPESELRALSGSAIGMVFQEPAAACNPVLPIGDQIAEARLVHAGVSRCEARREAVAWLQQMSIPDATRRVRAYPHQLSGGMCQRAQIAAALVERPRLLIADEPTSAVDVTTQVRILDRLRALRNELDLGILLITHDLGVVAEIADRVVVLLQGRVVETADVDTFFRHPGHAYSRALLTAARALEPEQS